MRTFLLLLALIFSSPALAQNTTCSDRPPTDSSNACANTRFVHNLIPTTPPVPYIWIGAAPYNAKCDGTTDDTAAIQQAWTDAGAANKNVYLGGVGAGTCKITSLVMPNPTAGDNGNRPALVGSSEGDTVLLSTVTGSSCAVTLNASDYGVNSSLNNTYRDFTIKGTNFAGNGLCLDKITRLTLSNVTLTTFSNGIFAQDTINVTCIACKFSGFASTAVDAVRVSNTYPNAWVFVAPILSFATNYGFIFDHPTDLNILGGDYENNNINGTAGSAVIFISGNPKEGSKGLNLSGGYFSANDGVADIFIDDGGLATPGVHSINAVELDRADGVQFTDHNIFLNNTGTGVTTLNIRGNGFQGFNAYVPDPARTYVAQLNPTATNFIINSGGNLFGSPTETPNDQWWEETGWVPFATSLGCGSGSLGTGNTQTFRYKRLTAKTIISSLTISIGAAGIGTCAGFITATLPVIAASNNNGMYQNSTSNISGSIGVAATSTTASLISSTAGFPLANSQSLYGTLIYEVQ